MLLVGPPAIFGDGVIPAWGRVSVDGGLLMQIFPPAIQLGGRKAEGCPLLHPYGARLDGPLVGEPAGHESAREAAGVSRVGSCGRSSAGRSPQEPPEMKAAGAARGGEHGIS